MHRLLELWGLSVVFMINFHILGRFLNNSGLRSIHSKYLLAILIDRDGTCLLRLFDKISWVYDRICFIFLSLLKILTVADSSL